ncbi:MAG TPA: glycoside hydrolase family 3 N-terminal domain-containing protein [Thermoanaerobaculia bacterium]|nr:glycoside hydrolase family 3 N-terminal domain-containing protein [Thermoanaerobaculia bacterium]
MDLARKIGKLFVVPARGDVIRHVRENHVGGVIWFESTAAEAKAVNAHLQSISETPLLISADLEAGMGMRFTDTTWWPPAMALAATGDPALAEEEARATAREALEIGVNHILAPVADVNVDPQNPVINTRSFGEDPHDVARYVAAFVRGVQEEGCLATAKHFPGHGDTRVDSHRALPVLDVTRERLDAVELVPFRAAIDAGVGSIMTGHLAVPALDDTPAPVRAEFENVYGTSSDEVTRGGTLPATVSKKMIDFLRRDLAFDGLIVTDSFDMGGLAAHFDPGEAAVRAIEAGNDQILYSADTDAAIAAVKYAVLTGRLPESRINESLERIAAAAERSARLQPGEGGLKPAPTLFIAQRAITLVRDASSLLPLRQTNFTTVVVSDFPEPNPVPDAVRMLGGDALFLDANSSEPQTNELVVMLLALRPKSGAGRIAVPAAARRLAERHARTTIAVSFGSPYVLREIQDVSTYICAYGIQPVMQIAAIRALRGEADMPGRLPVTL